VTFEELTAIAESNAWSIAAVTSKNGCILEQPERSVGAQWKMMLKQQFLKNLCQFQGSTVRSFILTTAQFQPQQELSVKSQVSTFEERGVSVMF
jgi:hypothetical protein